MQPSPTRVPRAAGLNRYARKGISKGENIMERDAGTIGEEYSKEVSKGGTKLLVIARREEEDQWQLSVKNEYAIYSNWLELFPTAQQAIDEGIKTIEKEGIDPFMETEGFEYLLE